MQHSLKEQKIIEEKFLEFEASSSILAQAQKTKLEKLEKVIEKQNTEKEEMTKLLSNKDMELYQKNMELIKKETIIQHENLGELLQEQIEEEKAEEHDNSYLEDDLSGVTGDMSHHNSNAEYADQELINHQ